MKTVARRPPRVLAALRPPAGRGDAVAEGGLAERTAGWVCTWQEYLGDADEAARARKMQQAENTGRPLGEERFVRHISALLGRDLVPKKAGRKPKTASADQAEKEK